MNLQLSLDCPFHYKFEIGLLALSTLPGAFVHASMILPVDMSNILIA